MARRVPDQERIPLAKIFDLPVKQPVVRRQAGEEYQRVFALLRTAVGPVVNLSAGHCVNFLCHFLISPFHDSFGRSRRSRSPKLATPYNCKWISVSFSSFFFSVMGRMHLENPSLWASSTRLLP